MKCPKKFYLSKTGNFGIFSQGLRTEI
jgi:hypothetical protein